MAPKAKKGKCRGAPQFEWAGVFCCSALLSPSPALFCWQQAPTSRWERAGP